MRRFSRSIAALLLLVLVIVIGCSTVSPDECWPNTSGGLGGSGTIPIGAGVGATSSGGDADGPSGGTPNPCVTPATPSSPDEGASTPAAPNDGTELGTYVRCLGLDWITCESLCLDIGAQCSALALNPDRPELGVGKLKQCLRTTPNTTCTYCFEGPISCTQIKVFGVPIRWMCNFPGGKGCE
jgi:hypothetical protein